MQEACFIRKISPDVSSAFELQQKNKIATQCLGLHSNRTVNLRKQNNMSYVPASRGDTVVPYAHATQGAEHSCSGPRHDSKVLGIHIKRH